MTSQAAPLNTRVENNSVGFYVSRPTAIKTNQIYLYNTYHYISLRLAKMFPKQIFQTSCSIDGLSVRTTREGLRAIAIFFRNSSVFQANSLVDIAVTDRIDQKGRFSVKYNLLSTRYQLRVSVEVFTNETLSIPSLAAAF